MVLALDISFFTVEQRAQSFPGERMPSNLKSFGSYLQTQEFPKYFPHTTSHRIGGTHPRGQHGWYVSFSILANMNGFSKLHCAVAMLQVFAHVPNKCQSLQ